MQRHITDQRIKDIDALGGLTTGQQVQAIQDADAVYRFMRRSESQRTEWVPDDALRKWGEQNDMDADRMNAALAVLWDSGRVLSYDEAAEPAATLTEAPTSGRQGAPHPDDTTIPDNQQRSTP